MYALWSVTEKLTFSKWSVQLASAGSVSPLRLTCGRVGASSCLEFGRQKQPSPSVPPGRRTLCAPLPLQFSAFPATGDSTCPPRCRAFLREIPNLRLVSSSVSVSQLHPGALFYFIWFCIIPWFLWSCFANPVPLEWPWIDVCRVCVSVRLCEQEGILPHPGNIALILLSNQRSSRRGQEHGLVQVDKVQDISLRPDF